MREPANPFILTGYHSPEYFCDREEELNWMVEQFENERNSVIYAWRRIGKTALIRHFFRHIEEKMDARTVFVDLLGTSSIQQAIKRLTDAIIQQQGDMKSGLGTRLLELVKSLGASISLDPYSGMPSVDFGLTQKAPVERSLSALANFLHDSDKPVVIAIDEFQQVTTYPEKNAESIFRTWIQEYPMIRFVFSGSHRHMMTSMFREESRPFYNSAQLLQLDHLPGSVYIPFIMEHFTKNGKNISRKLVNELLDWCQFQTYYVQLACNKLYAKSDEVTHELIVEVFNEMVEQEVPLFTNLQRLFTAYQWKLLTAIAKAEHVKNPMSKDFIWEYQLGATSSVQTALKVLVKKEFVIYEYDGYQLHDTLLMRWLQRI